MTTVEEILLESDDGSSLSAEVSFTLEDVLLEPDDTAIENIEREALDEIDEEGMFDDDMFEDQPEPTPEGQPPKAKDTSEEEKPKVEGQPVPQNEIVAVEPIRRERRLKDSALPDPATIRNMSFVVLKNVTQLFLNPQKKGLGLPTVITASSNKFLAIGTSQGSIAIFQVGVRGHKLLGGEQQKRSGAITSMSISRENRFLVAGQEGGLVTVWELSYFSELKRECWRRTRILKVLFCGEQEFLLNDQEGNVELVSIEKYLWTTLKPQKLLEKTDALYSDIRAHVLFAAPPLLALASLDYVLLLLCRPTVVPVARLVRPEDLLYNRLPCVAMGRCGVEGGKEGELGEVVCVAWGSSVVVYRVGEGRNGVQLAYRFQLQRAAQHIQFLSQGILVVLDGKETFRSFRLWLNGHTLLNEQAIPEQVLFQRFLKDRQSNPIRSYHNTLISCSLGRQKQFFFICKNSIYRCRMHRWNEAVSELINSQHEYALALRLCLELHQGHLDVFLERVKVTEKSIKVFCEIGRLYLSEGLKRIENLNKERVRNFDQIQSIALVEAEVEEMYDCLIEYMLEIGQTQYLFEEIYRKIVKLRHYNDDFHFKFLRCLEPFIAISALTRLPSRELFIEITQFFLKLGKKPLLETLVMSLEVESLYYEQALDLCSSTKLYRALAYVCSTHNDYISPLNKLLTELTQAQRQGLSNAWQIYYDILKTYLSQLLSGKLINGRPLKQDATMRKGLATWLTCSQTFSFFASNPNSILHTDYFTFLEDLLLQLSRQVDCQDYTHSILKQLMKERHKEQEIAELFVKVSPSIRLEQPEVDLVLKHSTQDQIDTHLPEYLLFMKQYLSAQAVPTTYLDKSKQLSYYWQLLKQQPQPLSSSNVLAGDPTLNKELVNFILLNQSGETVAERIEDLLKIDSESTMVYMLEKFSLEIVNSRLMTIRDEEYRYQVVRKLIKKLRKGQGGRLGPQVMKFYLAFLCRFNNEKRVYYEIVKNPQDYSEITVQLIEIISPLGYSSCLGVLELSRSHLPEAYNHFTKVYKHYFFEQNYRKLLAVKHCHGRFMRRIFQRMLAITQSINSEKQWMELLGCVIAPLEEVSKVKPRSGLKVCDEIQDVYEKKSQQPFLQQLGEILQECLVNVSSRLPIATISAFIGQHAYLFSKTLVLNSFRTTLATYSKNAHIFLLANQMVVDEQVAQFNKLQSCHIQGIVPCEICQICRKSYEIPEMIRLYPCGHSYHATCEPTKVEEIEEEEEIVEKVEKKEENLQKKVEIVEEKIKEGSEERMKAAIEEKCHRCRELKAGNSAGIDSEPLPDFHKESEDSLLLKGVKGIVNIIPTVIKAIPNPISVFTTPTLITDQPIEEEIDENKVYEYLAFENSIFEKSQEFSSFLDEYRRHLEQY